MADAPTPRAAGFRSVAVAAIDAGRATDGGARHRDQLIGIIGGTSASFAYDALGRRSARTVGGATTNFLYDGRRLVQELSGGSPTVSMLGGTSLDEILVSFTPERDGPLLI